MILYESSGGEGRYINILYVRGLLHNDSLFIDIWESEISHGEVVNVRPGQWGV